MKKKEITIMRKKKGFIMTDYIGWFLIGFIATLVIIFLIIKTFNPSLNNLYEYIHDVFRNR